MGIDLCRGSRVVKTRSKKAVLKSTDPYVVLLHKLHTKLSEKSDSRLLHRVTRRLCASNSNRQPVSVKRLIATNQVTENAGTLVVVGTVVDDSRIMNIPALRVAALRFTERVRHRIVSSGGQCLTLDQLALEDPEYINATLVVQSVKSRKAYRFFGEAPGSGHKDAAEPRRSFKSGKQSHVRRKLEKGNRRQPAKVDKRQLARNTAK